MKKTLSKLTFLFVFVILIGVSINVGAAKADAATYSGTCGAEGDNVTWSLDTDTGVLTISGKGEMASYSEFSSAPWAGHYNDIKKINIENGVTIICNYTFKNCANMTSIVIPDSVRSIYSYAFSYCSNLTSITIPDSVKSISKNAFNNCYKLKYSIYDDIKYLGNDENPYLWLIDTVSEDITKCNIHSQTKYIGGGAFYHCGRLKSVTIENAVTSIGGYAFEGCWGLTSVTFGNNVTSIGNSAFTRCSALKSVTIGSNVANIGNNAFSSCIDLSEVHISDMVAWCNIKFGTAASNPLYTAGNLYLNGNLVTKVVIPDSISSIGDYAFAGCKSLTSVTIPNSVTNIGVDTFKGCDNIAFNVYDNGKYLGNNKNPYLCLVDTVSETITECKIHSNTKIIHSSAFYRCFDLKEITIPDSVTSIGERAFELCTNMTSITFGKGIKSIGDCAFYHCRGLTSITIPNTVNHIGIATFTDCSSLKSINIPSSVTSIEGAAFYWCFNLTSVYYCGTENGWNAINIEEIENEPLINATKYYHKYSRTYIEPTCTVDGGEMDVCEICADKIVINGVAADGHKFGDWQVTLEPTYDAEGKETRYCSECDASEQRSIEKLQQPNVEEQDTTTVQDTTAVPDTTTVADTTDTTSDLQGNDVGESNNSQTEEAIGEQDKIDGQSKTLTIILLSAGALVIALGVVLYIVWFNKKR